MTANWNFRTRLMRAAAGLFALTLLTGGCEGSNLFEGEVAEEAPKVAALSVPGTVASGETFDVLVTGTAPRGVAFIEVQVSGAATDTVRQEYDGTSQTEFALVPVTPAFALGSTVTVDVFVSDVNGRNSPVRRATVNVTETGPAGSD